MADLFKSAVNYLSGSGGDPENEFVGKVVVLGRYELRVKKLLGGGGFSYVYVAEDTTSGEDYALKRIISDEENVPEVKREITFLKRLSGHPNIIQFITAASTNSEQLKQGACEFLIMTELCKGGELIEVLNARALSCRQVVRVFHQTCEAVAHMHQQKPPIIHRDLKVENLLLGSQGEIKLCDFGSATRESLYPDETWTHNQRTMTEELMQRYTTPMYRTPEMLDLYSNWPINERADIWALGCLLFMLCFREHPFEDGAKLRILNGNFKLPERNTEYSVLHDLIMLMLVVDPRKRPDIHAVIKKVEEIAETLGVDMYQPTEEPLIAPVSEVPVASGGSSAGQSLFGKVRSHASHLLKGIKDTSTKVMQSVAGYYKGDLDISYITSRMIVMPYPHEGLGGPMNNYIDDVREFLDSKHAGSYMVYNLAEKTYEEEKLHNKVSHVGWPSRRAPWLEMLLAVLKAIDSYLKSDPNNRSVAVINCEDGKSCSATVVAAYSIYCGLFSTSEAALRLFAERRYPSGYRGIIRASQRRYVDYVGQLVASPPFVPHMQKMKLSFITLTTIPMFNLNKTGCKPFIEVFERDTRVFSSVSKTSLDQLRSYTQDDGVIQIPLNVTVCGDVIVIVYHVRGMPGARVIHKGTTAVKMFQFQFHTGFVGSSSAQITLRRDELDGALQNRAKFPNPFQIILDIEFLQHDTQSSQCGWDDLSRETVTPLPCFSTMSEQQKTLEVYGRVDHVKDATSRQEYRDSPPRPHVKPSSQAVSKGPFFQSLDWQGSGSKQEESPRDQAEVNLLGDDWDIDEDAGISEDVGSIYSASESSAPSTPFQADLFGMSPQQSQPPSSTELLVQFDDDTPNFSQSQQPTQAPQQAPTVLLDFGEVPAPTSHSSAGMKHAASDSSLSKPPGDGRVNFFSGTINWPGIENQYSSSAPGSREATASPATTILESAQPAQGQKQSQTDLLGGMAFSPTNPFSQPGDLLAPSTGFNPFGPAASNDMQWMTDMSFLSGPPQQTQTTSQLQPPTALSQPFGSTIPPHQQASAGVSFDHHQSRRQSFPDLLSLTTSATGSSMPRVQTCAGQFTTPMAANFSLQGLNPSSTVTHGSTSVSAPPSSPGSPTGTAPFDPFAQFGNLRPSVEQQNFKQTKMVPSQKAANVPAMTPRTQYTASGFQQTTQKEGQSAQQPNKSTYTSVIGHREERGTRKPFGMAPAVQDSAFDDILGSHGFSPSRQKGPTSLNAIRGKSAEDDRDIDPDTLRVCQWATGKEKNIRALLSSLQGVLWDGASRWKDVGMHELVQPDQVKRIYKKACLCVHPDKLSGQPQEKLARAIFVALNEAYTAFEQSGARPLY